MLIKLAVLPGDGVGPEVVAQATDVVRVVGQLFGHDVQLTEALIGGIAIDKTGTALPDETVAICTEADAVLLGAVGGKKWDDPSAKVRPEHGLLALRKALGLYANLRPVRTVSFLAHLSPVRQSAERPTDFVVVRELTGGIYFGEKKLEVTPDGEVAYDMCVYSTGEVERITRLAGQLARQRGKRIISVDKANVLETSRLWRRVVERVISAEFQDIALEHMLVDACAMYLVQSPSRFDVLLTENMFGDILTDEASVLAGSMGLLPSASLGSQLNVHGYARGMFEPIHGSAPDIAGQGIANPVGAILSVAMMYRHSFGLEEAALLVEDAVTNTLASGVLTRDVAGGGPGVSTQEFGRAVVEEIAGVSSGARRLPA